MKVYTPSCPVTELEECSFQGLDIKNEKKIQVAIERRIHTLIKDPAKGD